MQQNTIEVNCLTVAYNNISRHLACTVNINGAKSLLKDEDRLFTTDCIAIWDTGATNSAITELTAKKLGLQPKGIKNVSGLGGTVPKKTYLIDLRLPNGIQFNDLSVTELDNPSDGNGNPVDSFGILIGMDIITSGDFAITNFEGKTKMTFRVPSIESIDFSVPPTQKKIGRKDPCPCGSQKRYENCHGKFK